MPLFHHKSDEEKQAEEHLKALRQQHAADQTESLRLLEAGEIPVQARRRLEELSAGERKLFTSDLSVPEFLLGRHEGLSPITQVMGSCFYHVGFSGLLMRSQWADSAEMSVITQAYETARNLALGRLRKEAELVGANAVVGVRLKAAEYEWSSDVIEYTAVGTAVHVEGAPPAEDPAITTFSGEDFWKLLQAGYGPVGVAAGTCVFYQVGWDTANMNSMWTGGWANRELVDLSRGFRDARAVAQQRMHSVAEALGAGGVVEVTMTQRQREREVEMQNELKRTDIIFTCLLLGTAIAPLVAERPAHVVKGVMPLSGRGLSRKKTDDSLDGGVETP